MVFLLILYGVYDVSKFEYFNYLMIYFVVFLLTYWIFFLGMKKIQFNTLRSTILDPLSQWIKPHSLIVISVFFICIHFIFINGFPSIQALGMQKLSEVVKLRASITESVPSWVNYMFSWNLKAIIPFTLAIVFLNGDKKWYWAYYFISIAYAFLLMQKSFILVVLSPVLIISLINKKWFYLIKYALSSILIVFFLTYIQNVTMRGGVNDIQLDFEHKKPSKASIVLNIFLGLKDRVAVTPGKTVTKWFEHIPQDKPFLRGNGFKLYAKLTRGEFHDYTKELYPLVYEENAKHGLRGTVNVAGFMRGYANFGTYGLLLAAIGLAFYLAIIELIFENHTIGKFALNIFPLIMLSSTSLLTILFSGGWFIIVLLFTIHKDRFNL